MDLGEGLFGGILGGVPKYLLERVPEHLRKDVAARLKDRLFGASVSSNHDLVRAYRRSWVTAARMVGNEARSLAAIAEYRSQAEDHKSFLDVFDRELDRIRAVAFNTERDPGVSPVDVDVHLVLSRMPEFVAGGAAGDVVTAPVTRSFRGIVSDITGWDEASIPLVLGQIAEHGISSEGGAPRSFGTLVFGAFAELIKSPKEYPEAQTAFSTAVGAQILIVLRDLGQDLDGLVGDVANKLADLSTELAREGLKRTEQNEQTQELLRLVLALVRHAGEPDEPASAAGWQDITKALWTESDAVLRHISKGEEHLAEQAGSSALSSVLGSMADMPVAPGSEFLAALLQLLRRYAELVTGSWRGAQPDRALEFAEAIGERLLPCAGDEMVELALRHITVLTTRVGRRLAFDSGFAQYFISNRGDYVAALQAATSPLLQAISQGRDGAALAADMLLMEMRCLAADTCLELAYEARLLEDFASAQQSLKSAGDLLSVMGPPGGTGCYKEWRLLEARTSLFWLDSGKLNASEIPKLIAVLRGFKKEDYELLAIRCRAQLLLAYKVKHGELTDRSISWQQMLRETTETVLDKVYSSPVDLRFAALLLHTERKLRELGSPSFKRRDEIGERILDVVPQLASGPISAMRNILEELAVRPFSADRQGDILARLFELADNQDLPSARKILVIECLLAAVDHVPPADIERAGIHRRKLESEAILHDRELFQSMLPTVQSSKVLRAAHLRFAERTMEKAIAAGERPDSPLLQSIKASYRYLTTLSRGDVAALAQHQLKVAKRAQAAGAHEIAFEFGEMAVDMAWRWVPNDLSIYHSAQRFVLEHYSERMHSHSVRQAGRRVRRIADLQDSAFFELDSLNYASSELLLANDAERSNRGWRLVFEAMAIAEAHGNEDQRQAARRQFIFGFINRLRRRARELNVEVSDDALIERFAAMPPGTIGADILTVLEHFVPTGLPTGSVVVARFNRIIPDGARAGVVFSTSQGEIWVGLDLLSRSLRRVLRPHVPEWGDPSQIKLLALDDGPESQLPVGERFMVNVLNPDRHGTVGTMVGNIFVRKAFNLLLPGIVTDAKEGVRLTMGASNSWAVAHIEPEHMTSALRGDGLLNQVMTHILGLLRFTLCPHLPNHPAIEMKHFVNNTWRDLQIKELSSRHIVLRFPEGGVIDEARLRGFNPLFQKAYPRVKLDMPRYERPMGPLVRSADDDW